MAAAFLAVALSLAPAQTACAGNGLTLATTPPRLGDPYAITLSGPPNASGVLAFDSAPGPIPTPFGPVCLGLTPAFLSSPIALDASGAFTMSGFLPPVPALAGLGVFMQAAVADPVQPAGIALSNGVNAVLRSPRVFFIEFGDFTLQQPGAWVAYDVLTDTMGPPVALPAVVRDAVAIPALGWIAFALVDGTVTVVDPLTSSIVLSVPLMAPGAQSVFLTVSGTTLFVTAPHPLLPPLLHVIRLPLGNVQTQPLPAPWLKFVAPPGDSSVYGFGWSSGTVFPYDIASGAPLAPISLTSNSDSWDCTWEFALHGQMLAILMRQGSNIGLNAIDTVTHAAVLPGPNAITSYSTYCGPGLLCYPNLRSGPGTTGPALLLRHLSQLFEISPQTLTPISAPTTLPYGSGLRLSNGGSDWLIPVPPASPCFACPPGTLQRLDPVTHALTTIDLLAGSTISVAVLPSGSLNLAFAWTEVDLKRYTTDPPGPGIVMPLPLSLVHSFVVVD